MANYFVDAVVLGSIYVLFALGLTLAWGALDILNLAYGSIMMLGVFIGYEITKQVDLSFPVLVLIGITTSAASTLILELAVFRQIRRRVPDKRQAELLMVIAGVGAAGIPLTIAQVRTNDSPFGIGHLSWHIFRVGAARISTLEVTIFLIGVGLCIAMAIWVTRTRTGRALRALAFDAETAEVIGINTAALSAVTMLISGALAGLSGILLTVYLGTVPPEVGDDFLLKGFAIIILGSVGSIWGTMIAGFTLAGVEIAVIATTSGTWTDAISFAAIVLVVLLRPRGLFGRSLLERV